MNDLQKYELEEIDGLDLQDEQIKERFKIENKEQLNWALRKLAALNEKETEVDELADKELYRIKSWHEKEIGSINSSKSFFESLISAYAINRRETDPKFKSVKTPYGKIGFKKQQPEYVYNDEDLLPFLEDVGYSDLFKIKKEPIKTEIKKQFKLHDNSLIDPETGEIIPGITINYREDKLDIKVGE